MLEKSKIIISEKGIDVKGTLFPVNEVYDLIPFMIAIGKETGADKSAVIGTSTGVNRTILTVPVGSCYCGFYVPLLISDIMNKSRITIYTVRHNIGNVIGSKGSNINETLAYIKEIFPDSKLKFISVKELMPEG